MTPENLASLLETLKKDVKGYFQLPPDSNIQEWYITPSGKKYFEVRTVAGITKVTPVEKLLADL